MRKFILIAAAVVVVIVVGGAAALMLWDVPAPTAKVERVIPDARFPR